VHGGYGLAGPRSRPMEPSDIPATARLRWRSYVLAACNLHMLLPGFKLPPPAAEKDFRDLIAEP
jgi:hypothetical protein